MTKTYEDGFQDGLKRGRQEAKEGAAGGESEGDDKPLTLDDIKAGRLSDAEIVEREDEIDALLAEQGQ
jgi:hypothetical protein